ncbi:hypothetical protein A2U01_0071766, partial [Trifolium medium]|nr:hypothetical protein [Trifolium medium]
MFFVLYGNTITAFGSASASLKTAAENQCTVKACGNHGGNPHERALD